LSIADGPSDAVKDRLGQSRSSVGVPECVRLFIAKGSFPAVDHLELAPHRREHRSMAPANGHETSHRPAVTLNDHLLPILDEIQQLRQLRLRDMKAHVHDFALVHS
jgi:hypothetical protein